MSPVIIFMVVDLPGTVRPQIASHFARSRRETHIVHGRDAGKAFGNATKLKHVRPAPLLGVSILSQVKYRQEIGACQSRGWRYRPMYWMRKASLPWPLTCNDHGMLDEVTGSLERYLDLLSARQKLVASNIANADTPGYQTQDIDFQSDFASFAKGQQPLTHMSEDLPGKPDGNNVNLDREARLLAENRRCGSI